MVSVGEILEMYEARRRLFAACAELLRCELDEVRPPLGWHERRKLEDAVRLLDELAAAMGARGRRSHDTSPKTRWSAA